MCRVAEAEGLSGWCGNYNGYPDPYCQVTILPNTPALKSEVRRGTSRKKTTNPNFQDVFSFAVCVLSLPPTLPQFYLSSPTDRSSLIFLSYPPLPSLLPQFRDLKHLLNAIVRVTVWHDPLIGEKVFLGQVNLSVGGVTTPYWTHDDWYWLCSRPATPTQASRPDIGSLRIKVEYAQDVIYPLKVYDALSQMLVEATVSSVSIIMLTTGEVDYICLQQKLCDTAVFILGEVHRDWSGMGRSLVRIFLALDKVNSMVFKVYQNDYCRSFLSSLRL